jgi:exodeoxyribonuclease V alpha subunit
MAPSNKSNDCITMQRLEGILSDYEHTKHELQLIHKEPILTKSVLLSKIIKPYKIPLKSIFSIMNRFIIEHNETYLITNLLVHPEQFMLFNDPMISYDITKAICKKEELTHINLHKAWCYDYFITKSKSFYVNARHFKQDFIDEFGVKEYTTFQQYLIQQNKQYITLQEYIDYENELSNQFKSCFETQHGNQSSIQSFINNTTSITLNEEQKEALIQCVMNKSHIVCGFPGTGKSTIVNVLKDYLYSEGHIISAVAPTGLAIKNLLSKCSMKNLELCGTIHKMLYSVYPYMKFSEIKPSEKQIQKIDKYKSMLPSVIIVDEVSMIDTVILEKLLYYTKKFDAKLILLGDENQLQPVGAGNPLNQMTKSTFMKPFISNLTQIMRQDNPFLISNIKRIHDGEYLMEEHFDGKTMIKQDYNHFIDKTTKEVTLQSLNTFIQANHLTKHNSQFLTPENHKNCGSTKMNMLLQRIYNKNKTIPYTNYKLYDLVVRTQNCIDQEQMFANGETGTIWEYDQTANTVTIMYDSGQKQVISYQELFEEFSLRYCMTIHKSQGSEYENVILFMGTPHESSSWKQSSAKKLLYTAVSRTKERCFVIEKKGVMNIAQSADEKIEPSMFLS